MVWKFDPDDDLPIAISIFSCVLFGAMLLIHTLQPEGRETHVPAAQQRQYSQ